MRQNNKILTIIIVFVLLIGVALVFVVTGRNDSPEQIVAQPEQNEEVVVADTEVPAVEVQDTAEPTQEEAAAEPQAAPALKTGLQGTDPATVNLASGEIQLVEAFAFW